MEVRCDKSMRRSKERARNWECTKECCKCICGIVKDANGNESHVKREAKA